MKTAGGDWWLAHVCSWPPRNDAPANEKSPDPMAAIQAGDRCTLGRETAVQRVVWSADGWPRLANGGVLPDTTVPAELASHPWPPEPTRDDFDGPVLNQQFSTPRVLADESWLSLTARPGLLRLRGRESPSSLHEQSVVARRLRLFRATAETRIEFAPVRFTQMAGLVCWCDTRTYF